MLLPCLLLQLQFLHVCCALTSLKAAEPQAGAGFGEAVALDDGMIVVGAPRDGGGSVHTYTPQDGSFLHARVSSPNGEPGDLFGTSVGLSEELLVVGAPGEDSSQSTIGYGVASADNSADNSGAVYVFVRRGDSWEFELYLKSPNVRTRNYFGAAVAVTCGSTIVVGERNVNEQRPPCAPSLLPDDPRLPMQRRSLCVPVQPQLRRL